ncbi:hypothetical protein F5X96DRAFT_648960 [Biscogniauxia mediterranea]|nr:hypothetical protein F5X96DRAFT_648960 [Biscogniauxia mediterranea]
MLANLRTQASLLLLASSLLLVSGATIPDLLLPEPVSEGDNDVKVYTVDNGHAHGRVTIIGGSSSKVSASASATAGRVSDCFIETTTTGELFPRSRSHFFFKHPEADRCFAIGASRKLQIWKAAACADGSAALLARYDGPGCDGEPAMLDAVGADMIRACLDMPTEGPGSYAFWCSGEIREEAGVKDASDVDGGKGSGSGAREKGKGGLGTFVLVLSVIGLFGLTMLVITIYRLLKMSQWFLVSTSPYLQRKFQCRAR